MAKSTHKEPVWHPGARAPVRPVRTGSCVEKTYVAAMERYADNLEQMLVWFARDYAQFPNRIKNEMDRVQAEVTVRRKIEHDELVGLHGGHHARKGVKR